MATESGSGTQGQESGAATGGQSQEGASQQGSQSSQQQGTQGQESGNQQQGSQGNGAVDFSKMSDADLRAYAERTQAELARTRGEAANYRTQFQEAQGKLTEAERAKMSELEKAQADAQTAKEEAEQARKDLRDLRVGGAAQTALEKAKALNPATALKVMGDVPTTAKGELDEAKLTEAIADLKKTDPYLFARGASADAGQGKGAAAEGSSSINDYIRGRG